MNLISIEKISKSYGEKVILNDVSFGIEESDKMGIIGINGTGKSTLLKIIAGVEDVDSGRIIQRNDMRIEYLPQNPYMDEDATVLEQVFKSHSPVMKVVRDYEYTVEKLKGFPEDEKLVSDLIRLNDEMDRYDAWNLEADAKAVLTKLGIYNFDQKVSMLSGGQRKRVALAGALINPCDLLILDEPTNHIDNETLDWLEAYLKEKKGSLLMITHDRYFLDRVANRIIELEDGNVYSYEGGYSIFVEKKIERQELEARLQRKRDNFYKRELSWIKAGVKARSTKQKARIKRFEELDGQDMNISNEELSIDVAFTRLGNKVIEISNLKKSYEDKKIIEDFTLTIPKGEVVGIVGENGIGKSTFLNMIAGRIGDYEGKIDIGETVKLEVFDQEAVPVKEDTRVIDLIKEEGQYIRREDGSSISASQMLETFMFPKDFQWTEVEKLSGGERRRLELLRVLMKSPNVILLDEPTNDLDIATLSVLEDYIDQFNGSVIVVSHDRYFLDKVADRILAFEGDGRVINYVGNYSGYMEFKKENMICEEGLEKVKKQADKKTPIQRKKTDQRVRFSYKDKLEYENIEGEIENIESRIMELEEEMGKNSSDFVQLQKISNEKEELEAMLEQKMERWEYLSEIAEKIESGSN